MPSAIAMLRWFAGERVNGARRSVLHRGAVLPLDGRCSGLEPQRCGSACPPAHTLFTPANDSRRMLFRSQVIYIEHSRAMTQTWVPMRTWWLLSFYAAALVL